jgi:galactokinase
MLDIGHVHRREYVSDTGRAGAPSAGSRAVKKSGGRVVTAKSSKKSAVSKGGAASKGSSASRGSSTKKGIVSKKSAAPQKSAVSKKNDVSEVSKQIVIAQAPGRLHLLGEHGYPGAGLYLSAAIDRWVKVAVSARKDNSLRFYAADLGERKRTTLANLKFKREDRWANYIKVAIHVFAQLGFPVKGANFTIIGDIPQQIGLASSSAIEVASAVALRSLLHVKIGDMALALRLANAHEFIFGNPGDLADYITGLTARSDQFLLIDEQGPSVTKIKSPFSRCKIIIMDSRVPRFGIDVELDNRQQDIKAGLAMLSQGREGASFREYAAMDLVESMGNLPEEIRRRSLHVVQEIRRVFGARDYLIRGDLADFSRLVFNSHESLRDLYEVSCPEIDWMVKRAQETIGVYGARMTGQGFGGCTYTIIKNEMVSEFKNRLDDYERIFGFRPAIYEVKLATGSRVVK